MSTPVPFGLLPESFLIKIVGSDARRIVNNLTTNNIAELPDHSGCETFVTNGKGWTVAHGHAFSIPASDDHPAEIWLAGQHPNPTSIAEHIDRYIIREDAQVQDASPHAKLLLAPMLEAEGLVRLGALPGTDFHFYLSESENFKSAFEESSELAAEALEALRIRVGWPLQGREIQEKTIPQEMDRDETAISFTKGCYLGQETIARLDALGQLQRKLCILACETPQAEVKLGDSLQRDDKEVGILSSLAPAENGFVGLATVKRGSFEAGTELLAAGNVWQVL